MRKLHMRVTGTSPLLVQSDRLANPLDPLTKAKSVIASKQRKTEQDHLDIMRIEFYGSLYYDPEIGPYMPAPNFERCLKDAGGLSKKGKAIERGVMVTTERAPIRYRGSRDIDELWANENYHFLKTVKNSGRNGGRVIRMRPIFREWAIDAEVELIENQIGVRDFERILEAAGQLIGLGSWRPRYGRFEAEVKTA